MGSRSTSPVRSSALKQASNDVPAAIVVAAFFAIELVPLLRAKLTFSSDVVLNQLTWGTIYIFAIVGIARLGGPAARLAAKARLIGVFCLVMLVSTLWSVAPSRTLVEAIELVGSGLLGFYLVLRFPLGTFLRIVMSKFAFMAAASYFLIMLAPGRGRDDWGSGPWSGIYPDKNALGTEAALALITLLIVIPKTAKGRFAAVLGAICFGGLLIGSRSATAFTVTIATLSVAAVILVCRSPKVSHGVRYAVVGAVGVGLCCVLVLGVTADSVLGMLGKSSSLTGRTDFWPYLVQAFWDRPLLGYGYNAFFGSEASYPYLSTYVLEMSGGWYPYYAHNSLLQVALSAGVLGVAVGIAVVGSALYRTARYCLLDRRLVAIWPICFVLYIVFSSYTESTFGMFNSDLWVFFVAAALYPSDGRVVVEQRTEFAPRVPWWRARGSARSRP
jgi:exopolysaccharide production protein ExoQ